MDFHFSNPSAVMAGVATTVTGARICFAKSAAAAAAVATDVAAALVDVFTVHAAAVSLASDWSCYCCRTILWRNFLLDTAITASLATQEHDGTGKQQQKLQL